MWFISLAIASPIILLSVLDPENVLHHNTCAIFNQYFLIYGSLAAFFIPLLIMLIAYSLTIHILNQQARRCAENAKKGAPQIRRSLSRRRRSRDLKAGQLHKKPSHGLANIHTANGLNFAKKLQTQLTQLDRTKSHPSEREPLHAKEKRKSRDSSSPSPSPQVARIQMQFSRLSSQNSEGDVDSSGAASPAVTNRLAASMAASLADTRDAGATPSETASLGETERDGSESPAAAGAGAAAGPARRRGGSPRLQALVKKHSAAIKVASVLMQKSSESKHKRELNTVKTERKAVKVLGTMFFIFVLCWGPFFSLNFAMGVCESCDIDVILFKVFLWLGYVSSLLNPVIYTIFNRTFKQTFIQILTCKHCSLDRRKTRKSPNFMTANGNSIKVKYECNAGTTSSLAASSGKTGGAAAVKLRHNESMV